MIDFSNDVVLFLLLIFLLFLAPTVQFVTFKLRVLDRTTRSLSSYRPLPLFRLLFRSSSRDGCLFSTSRQQRGWCTILKAIYTNTLCCHACAFPHTYSYKVHIYYGMTKEHSRAAILVSKEHLTLFFYSSLFSQRRPFTFRPPHSSSSSALPSSLIKAWRLSAKRTSLGTPIGNLVAEHYEWDEGAREIQIEGRTIIGGRTVCWTPYNGNFLLVLIKKLCDRNEHRGSASSSINNRSYCSFLIRKEKKKRACLDNYNIDEQHL